MKTAEIKKIILESIKPKYEMVRDSHIFFNNLLVQEYRDVLKTQKNRKRVAYGAVGYDAFVEECRACNRALYGNPKEKELGLYDRLQKAGLYKLVYTQKATDTQIKAHTIKLFKEIIKNTVDSIATQIKALKPKDVREGSSHHDINFIITEKTDIERSFTINTIIAEGDIQIKHYRTLRKLHKGVV